MDWMRLEELTRHLGTTRVEDSVLEGIDLTELIRLVLAGKTLAEAQRALATANRIGPNLNAVFAARERVDEALAAWNAIDPVDSSPRTPSRRRASRTG